MANQKYPGVILLKETLLLLEIFLSKTFDANVANCVHYDYIEMCYTADSHVIEVVSSAHSVVNLDVVENRALHVIHLGEFHLSRRGRHGASCNKEAPELNKNTQGVLFNKILEKFEGKPTATGCSVIWKFRK